MISDKQRQWFIIGLIILAIAAGIYYGTLSLIRRDTGEIIIDILPTNATVLIDGKKAGQGSHFLNSGVYEVEMSANGFAKNTRSILVEKGSKEIILESLVPNSSEGEKWISDHSEAYAKYEEKGGIAVQKEGVEIRSKFPIIQLLPFTEAGFSGNNSGFTIGYRAPKDDSLIVTIHASSSLNRQLALSKIKGWGYDPANYTIEFSDFTNPFARDEVEEE